ncbi:unnamed protein product [Prorocentrum cordatum]|uniref:Uncharacterized protein n=1 Tax=Prorocentrum cordatum TaxID=2364126 RepID=A0ABN9SPH1_9DINO|nr:unnamed protein product [Polarella glacialis]
MCPKMWTLGPRLWSASTCQGRGFVSGGLAVQAGVQHAPGRRVRQQDVHTLGVRGAQGRRVPGQRRDPHRAVGDVELARAVEKYRALLSGNCRQFTLPALVVRPAGGEERVQHARVVVPAYPGGRRPRNRAKDTARSQESKRRRWRSRLPRGQSGEKSPQCTRRSPFGTSSQSPEAAG